MNNLKQTQSEYLFQNFQIYVLNKSNGHDNYKRKKKKVITKKKHYFRNKPQTIFVRLFNRNK